MYYLRGPPRPRHLLRVPAPKPPGADEAWYALVELRFEQFDGSIQARRMWELRWKKNRRAPGYKYKQAVPWHNALPSLDEERGLLPPPR